MSYLLFKDVSRAKVDACLKQGFFFCMPLQLLFCTHIWKGILGILGKQA